MGTDELEARSFLSGSSSVCQTLRSCCSLTFTATFPPLCACLLVSDPSCSFALDDHPAVMLWCEDLGEEAKGNGAGVKELGAGGRRHSWLNPEGGASEERQAGPDFAHETP